MAEVTPTDEPPHQAEFSECIIHDENGCLRVEWTTFGWRHATLVAEELIDQWIAETNELRGFRARG